MAAEIRSIVPLPWRRSFARARAALSDDDVATARPLLDELASALPDNLEVQLYAAWARARLAESLTDREREALEALARRALGGHQSLALPLCILGHAAVRRGELGGAKSLFRHAAKADPALVDARRGLQMVERRLAGHDVDASRSATFSFVDASRSILASVGTGHAKDTRH